jgi:endogenous inhibitor of DNA gyrase (YacG/DUF329 family)
MGQRGGLSGLFCTPRRSHRCDGGDGAPVPDESHLLNARAKTANPCPICGKPRVEQFRPFCSRRCADIDLHRWLGGAYTIPATEQDDDEPDEAGPDNADPGER